MKNSLNSSLTELFAFSHPWICLLYTALEGRSDRRIFLEPADSEAKLVLLGVQINLVILSTVMTAGSLRK